jgi:hypothetical protein
MYTEDQARKLLQEMVAGNLDKSSEDIDAEVSGWIEDNDIENIEEDLEGTLSRILPEYGKRNPQ